MRRLSFSSNSSKAATSLSNESLNVRLNTPIAEVPLLVDAATAAFEDGRSMPIARRKDQLERLKRHIIADKKLLCYAIQQDFHRHPSETELVELGVIVAELDRAIKNIDSWSNSSAVSFDFKLFSMAAQVTKEPYGVVLIVGPANFPYLCLVAPIVSAIAAGNCVIAKPSHASPYASEAILRTLESALDPQIFRSVTGGELETQELLKQKFDKIFFTGSQRVGKMVYQAAVKNLTPTILELGGKCPAIVSSSCNLKLAAKRIAWGKFMNAGQTCVAPDYILVENKVQDRFVTELMACVEEMYPHLDETSSDFAHMITEESWDRATKLLEQTKGLSRQFGKASKFSRFFPPTVVSNVQLDDALMEEEIFAPILPVIGIDSVSPVVVKPIVQRHDTPLAVYIFTNLQSEIDSLCRIRCAAVVANDTIMQASSPAVKFGGFGSSGMGSYHGKTGFDSFTFERPYMNQPSLFESGLLFRYPPYTKSKQQIIERTVDSKVAVIKGSITGFIKSL